jgi:hypothetical protein
MSLHPTPSSTRALGRGTAYCYLHWNTRWGGEGLHLFMGGTRKQIGQFPSWVEAERYDMERMILSSPKRVLKPCSS